MCIQEMTQPIGKDYIEIMKRKKKHKNKYKKTYEDDEIEIEELQDEK